MCPRPMHHPKNKQLKILIISHKASIQLIRNESGTTFGWETEVDPAAVEPFIQQGMETSLERLREVLAKEN